MKPDKTTANETTVRLVRFNEKVLVAIFPKDSIQFEESTDILKDKQKDFETLFDSSEIKDATSFDRFLDSDELFDFLAVEFKTSSKQEKIIFIKLDLEKLKINQNKESLQKLKVELESALSQMSDGKKERFEKFINKFRRSLIYRGLQDVGAEFKENKSIDPARVVEKPDQISSTSPAFEESDEKIVKGLLHH